MIHDNEEWEWAFNSFSLSFLYLDNLNDGENGIKSDYNGNEISLISGISIHPNYELFWFLSISYF